MIWGQIYNNSLTSTLLPSGGVLPIPPVEIPLSGSLVAISATSPDLPTGPDNLRLVLLVNLPGAPFPHLESPLPNRPTINRQTLIQVPPQAGQRTIRIEIPPWYSTLNLEVWETAGGVSPPGADGVEIRELLSVSTAGQSRFVLSQNAANPALSRLYINGIKATYGTEYAIDGLILDWLSPLTLESTDEVEVIYLR